MSRRPEQREREMDEQGERERETEGGRKTDEERDRWRETRTGNPRKDSVELDHEKTGIKRVLCSVL